MRNGSARKIDGADIAERTKRVQLSFCVYVSKEVPSHFFDSSFQNGS